MSGWAAAAQVADSALGATISGLFANASAYKQYKYQRDLMNQQSSLNYRYAKKQTLNQYGWQRQGLESAGYNPMLALQGAAGPADASFNSGGSATAPDYIGALQLGLDKQRLANESKVAESQVKLSNADTVLRQQQTVDQLIRNNYLDKREASTIANIQKDTMLKQATIDNYEASVQLGYAGLSNATHVANINAQAQKYSADKSYSSHTDMTTNTFGLNVGKIFGASYSRHAKKR